MTPDRLQEIRQRLEKHAEAMSHYRVAEASQLRDHNYVQDITDLLAALATAEAEGRRQGIEQGKWDAILAALLLIEGEYLESNEAESDVAYNNAITHACTAVRQLLPSAQTEAPRP